MVALLAPLRAAICSVVMARNPFSCNNSDVAVSTAIRDCSLRGRPIGVPERGLASSPPAIAHLRRDRESNAEYPAAGPPAGEEGPDLVGGSNICPWPGGRVLAPQYRGVALTERGR